LLNVILGLIKPMKGLVQFSDDLQLERNNKIGYLPQQNQIDKKFPITDSSRHVKTAGSTSRPTVNSPAFLLYFADGVDEVLIVQPEGPLAQTSGIFWQAEMLAESFHLTHSPKFTENACHFCHEWSGLAVVQLRYDKSSIGLLPRDGESRHA
jgi:hypothetical protein